MQHYFSKITAPVPRMMEPSFEKLLVKLAEADIAFIVVGGAAVTFQGYVRLTEDLDILVEHSPENLTQLLTTLSHYGEGFAKELALEDFSDQEGAIRIVEETEQMQLDIFTRMSGRRYPDILTDADFFTIQEKQIAVASKRSLIGWKEKSLRDKDRLDAQALHILQQNPHAFD